MKKFLYSLATLALAVSAQAAPTEVTSLYLTDSTFDGPTFTFAKEDATKEINNNKAVVEGWVIDSYPSEHAYGTVEYGFAGKLKGQCVGPTAGYEGSTGGYLVAATAWSGKLKIKSTPTTLPAGRYIVQAAVYNAADADKTVAYSNLGIATEAGMAGSTLVTYPSKQWIIEEAIVTLAADVTGSIQLGYSAPNSGSGSNPQLCYDWVKVFYEPLEAGANLVYNPEFADNGKGWSNVTKSGTTTFEDGTAHLTTAKGDNVLTQPLFLDPAKSYTYISEYKNDVDDKAAFSGFWPWGDNKANWKSGAPYADYGQATEWKQVSNPVSGEALMGLILAANKEANVYYRNPVVIENPTIAATASNGTITVTGAEGFTTKYAFGDGEETEFTGSFTTAEEGICTIKAYYSGVVVATTEVTVATDPLAFDYKLLKEEVLAYLGGLTDELATAMYGCSENGLALMELVYAEEMPADVAAALAQLQTLYAAAKADMPKYESLSAAQMNATQVMGACPDAAAEKQAAVTKLLAVAEGITGDEALEHANKLTSAIRALIQSNAYGEGFKNYADMAEKLPANTTNSLEGWTNNGMEIKGGEGPTLADGTVLNNYYDHWNGGTQSCSMSVAATLEAGKYRLSALLRATTDKTVTIYAGEEEVETTCMGSAGGYFGCGWIQVYVDFTVAEAGDVELGAKFDLNNSWAGVTNYKLSLIEKASAEGAYAALKAEVAEYLASLDELAMTWYCCTPEGEELMGIVCEEETPADVEAAYTKLAALYAAALEDVPHFEAMSKHYSLGTNANIAYIDAAPAKSATLTSLLSQCEGKTAAEARAHADALATAYRAVIESHMVGEGYDDYADCTAKLPDTLNDATGWTNENMGTAEGQGPTLADGTTINKYFDKYINSGAEGKMEVTIDLPYGTYRFAALTRAHAAAPEFKMYAADKEVTINAIGSKDGYFGNGWEATCVDFTLAPTAETPESRAEEVTVPVKLGFATTLTQDANWISFTNIKLALINKYTDTAVSAVEVANDTEAEYYNLQGVRVANPAAGLYIRVLGNTATKVLVK